MSQTGCSRWSRTTMMLPGADGRNALHVVRCGPEEAEVVVLVHAIGLDLTYWDAQIAALSRNHAVVAYDLLGHGQSSKPEAGYQIGDMAEDLAAVVAWASRKPVHLVGVSLGGMIAQTFALEHLEAVRSLTLIDTVATLGAEARDAIAQRSRLTREGGMEAIVQPTIDRWFTPEFVARRPDVVGRVRTTLLANDREVHASIWDAIAKIDLADRLPAISCPVLVLVGERDPTTPIAASRLIADRIRGSRLHLLPGVSHMSPLEGSEQVNQLLCSFVGEQR